MRRKGEWRKRGKGEIGKEEKGDNLKVYKKRKLCKEQNRGKREG